MFTEIMTHVSELKDVELETLYRALARERSRRTGVVPQTRISNWATENPNRQVSYTISDPNVIAWIDRRVDLTLIDEFSTKQTFTAILTIEEIRQDYQRFFEYKTKGKHHYGYTPIKKLAMAKVAKLACNDPSCFVSLHFAEKEKQRRLQNM
jgi:hypothetical protein